MAHDGDVGLVAWAQDSALFDAEPPGGVMAYEFNDARYREHAVVGQREHDG